MEDAADEKGTISDNFEEFRKVSRVVDRVHLHREAHEGGPENRGTHLAQSWVPTRHVSFSVKETDVAARDVSFPDRLTEAEGALVPPILSVGIHGQ